LPQAAEEEVMTNIVRNYSIPDTIKIGYKDVTAVGGMSVDLTKFLYNLPTLNVSGSSQQPSASVSLANVQCVNFIGGVRVATLQSATMAGANTPYVFANTSGTYPVSIQFDNGATIGGLSVYPLNSGVIVQFGWNGTNLN
jgi:hypothetical protein